jgi:hypothetical protein
MKYQILKLCKRGRIRRNASDGAALQRFDPIFPVYLALLQILISITVTSPGAINGTPIPLSDALFPGGNERIGRLKTKSARLKTNDNT